MLSRHKNPAVQSSIFIPGFFCVSLNRGAGDYGQLGQGFMWDDAKPKLINDLKDVTFIAAGLRHSVAIRTGLTHEILGWGYNGYGELGMGDLEVRLQPSKISALSTGKNLSVSCGDRHTCIITSHKMLRAKDDTSLRPFYSILEVILLRIHVPVIVASAFLFAILLYFSFRWKIIQAYEII